MPNVQLNTCNDINAYLPRSQIAVSMPVVFDEDKDSSKNAKNNNKYLLRKLQSSSPRLEKSFREKAISEKIFQFNSLNDEEKLNLMKQSYDNVIRYIDSLSDEKKAAFLSKFNSLIVHSQKVYQGDGGGVENIMMIITKAFVKNMNTQALDELQEAFEANLINNFLQNVQNQMKEQISEQEDLASELSGESGFWSTGNKIMLGISIGVAVLSILAIFFPPAEIITAAFFEGVEVVATDAAADVATDAAADGAANAVENAADAGVDAATQTDDVAESVEGEVQEENALSSDEEKISSNRKANDSSNLSKSKESQQAEKLDQKIADAESGVDKNKKELTWGERIKRKIVFGEDWNKEICGVEKTDELSTIEKVKGVAKIGKRMGKSLAIGGGVFAGGSIVTSLVSPNGQQNEQNQLNDCQNKISSATTASDILNNNEQQVSKRISDDSQRISQSSGYVQQAINMLGTAMSFKV